ncbi:PREDICTED: brachyurin-like [Rhagoletis zephyria]|uniref:brachyurin-like n=1 Tax=Rhagoletis zephyria TaxID=28612 RepID=UPI0008118A14|nr:PREDICTED: brachyurin-like [Rhagoletis zephyria]
MSLPRTLLAVLLSYVSLCALSGPPMVQGFSIGQSKYGRIEKFPYQVMLIGKQLWRKRILCGGTLLDQRWILTAGHCTMGVTHFDIYLGALTVEDTPETGRLVLRSNKFIAHEGFNPETAANDIALIKLPVDVAFTQRIQPATLPYLSRKDALTGAKVVATGWGANSELSNYNPMQYTELRVISNQECANEFDVITNGVLCAKGLRDETVCSGDSGGPLVLKNTQIVVGITSFGPADGCETNIPGGFTRVTYYLDWIEAKTGKIGVRVQAQNQWQWPAQQAPMVQRLQQVAAVQIPQQAPQVRSALRVNDNIV